LQKHFKKGREAIEKIHNQGGGKEEL